MRISPFLHRLSVAVAASGPGSRVLSRILHRIDPLVFRLTGGRHTLSGLLTGLPVVLLTTKGRKSGQPRTVPLLAILDPERPDVLVLVASNWGQRRHPGWYYNLQAHPEAACTVAGATRRYRAREAAGEEYARLWQRAAATYPGFPRYKVRAGDRRIPILVLEPKSDASG